MKKKEVQKEKKVPLKEKQKKFTDEFKQFIAKGNVLDLAVGVIIGGAFGKIVTSLVNDIIMPLVGVIIGGKSFESLTLTIGDSVITYGAFIQNIVDFLIVALCIFVFIKIINSITAKTRAKEEAEKKKKEDEEKKANETIVKAEDIKLLEEIRDLLKRDIKTKKK